MLKNGMAVLSDHKSDGAAHRRDYICIVLVMTKNGSRWWDITKCRKFKNRGISSKGSIKGRIGEIKMYLWS